MAPSVTELNDVEAGQILETQASRTAIFCGDALIPTFTVAAHETIEAIGMSHVRFNREGKVVFQQDYWDTSAMLDRLPVVGYWTRLVKNKINKGLEP